MNKSRNQDILQHFLGADSWEERYKKIIQLGEELPSFPDSDKQDKLLVKGCQSQLWIKAEEDKKGNLVFTGDSDALISKGILALMILFYSKRSPSDILKGEQASFFKDLDLNQHLSLHRAQGLTFLQKQILSYAKASYLLQKF